VCEFTIKATEDRGGGVSVADRLLMSLSRGKTPAEPNRTDAPAQTMGNTTPATLRPQAGSIYRYCELPAIGDWILPENIEDAMHGLIAAV